MKIAHIADTHLGYSAYNKLAPTGANQRSVDVAMAFRAMIDGVITAKVGAVLFAGDFFDHPKPSNTAIRFAVQQLQRLRTALPGVPVVIISGNHDENRRSETGSILPMFSDLGLADVAQGAGRHFLYPDLGLRIVAAPHQAVVQGQIPEAEGTERFQVLLAHGEMPGAYTKYSDRPSGHLPVALVSDPKWSAVCLGDWHLCRQVADRAWYPGSSEYTSSNPWSEIAEPKCWLLVDLETGTVERHLIAMSRAIYDLPEINAADLDPAAVNALIVERLATVDITDALVRLKVLNLPNPVRRELDHAMIRSAKARALNLNLDCRPPENVLSVCARPENRRQTLNQIVADFLGSYSLTPGVDRSAFAKLGNELMDGVAEAQTGKERVA